MEDEGLSRVWKEFGKQTEAGKLLYDLYGVRYRPDKFVKYPKLKMKSKEEKDRAEILQNTKKTNKVREAAKRIDYPELRKKYSQFKFNKVDFIPKRKKENVIQGEISSIKREINAKNSMPTQLAKNRKEIISKLQDDFEFQERKVMPKGARMPGIKEDNKKGEKTLSEPVTAMKPQKGSKEELQLLYDQIMDEIDERYKYMEEIKTLGKNNDKEIMGEIRERLDELKKIQKMIDAYKCK